MCKVISVASIKGGGNSRNGYIQKTLQTSYEKVGVKVPRDRQGEFEQLECPNIMWSGLLTTFYFFKIAI